jgi:hypothetical protein
VKAVMRPGPLRRGRLLLISAVAAVLTASGLFAASLASAAAPGRESASRLIAPTGLKPGSIKHVWLIILENKSYDATFTGLNDNSYLWKDLPAQGALLTNYYGTGHSSMDNYLSLVSGQAPSEDVQEDCSTTDNLLNLNSGIETAGGSLRANPDYGQLLSKAGPNAALGENGCTFPTNVPTLFNQLNAAGLTWKDYDQDLGGEQNFLQDPDTAFQSDTVPGREDAACGGPGTAANNANTDPLDLATPPGGEITSYTGAQSASSGGTDYIDQYVAKHNPVPWFESLTGQVNADGTVTPALNEPASGGTNCGNVVNLDSPGNGLVHDLKANTVPAFSWITPDNCSDAHDAVCKGNNLSGAFSANGTPNYELGTSYAYDPQTIPPANYTGGLYASDLFLEYYIPLIEQSQAFRDGGLIDITFDEGFPPFTYTGDSFNNEATSGPGQPANAPTYGKPGTTAPGADSIYGAYGIYSDAAGENIHGRNVGYEPTGPNSTLQANGTGDQLYPGPGNNAFIDRPPACTSLSPTPTPAGCVPGIVEGGSGSSPGARTDTVTTTAGSNVIADRSIVADDTGREVTGSGIPANSFVGAVTDTGPDFPTTNTGSATTGSFQLVDQVGNPVDLSASGTQQITLSAEGAPGELAAGETVDPLYDATDPTPGGGDTGSVLISPFIRPGTVSNVYYNHYSWLATMEDVFDVAGGNDWVRLNPGAGSVSGGLDGEGHLGYAAQPGLRPFGPDVFTNPSGQY